ncbi:uncharacterized protein DS421_20g683850 [Arachis hypogaea]|nr:uncharacterized protein DS421_20g683850 [Arachis hypogaea]
MLLHKAKEDKDEALKTDQEVSSQLALPNSTDDSMMNNQQIVLAESPLPPPLPKARFKYSIQQYYKVGNNSENFKFAS